MSTSTSKGVLRRVWQRNKRDVDISRTRARDAKYGNRHPDNERVTPEELANAEAAAREAEREWANTAATENQATAARRLAEEQEAARQLAEKAAAERAAAEKAAAEKAAAEKAAAEKAAAEKAAAEKAAAEKAAAEKAAAEKATQARIKSGKITVGAEAKNPMQIAAANFSATLYDPVMLVLKDLQQTGRVFDDLETVLQLVRQNPVIAEQLAREAEERRLRDAREAEDRRLRAAVVYEIPGNRSSIKVTEYDISHGRWERIRDDDTYCLTIGGNITFHVHPPKFRGGEPVPGGFKCRGQDPGLTQTPVDVMRAILRLQPRPTEW
jgi:hypothetical protein